MNWIVFGLCDYKVRKCAELQGKHDYAMLSFACMQINYQIFCLGCYNLIKTNEITCGKHKDINFEEILVKKKKKLWAFASIAIMLAWHRSIHVFN